MPVKTGERINGLSGIYCIIHRDSKAVYIGSSIDMGRRRVNHIGSAKANKPGCFNTALRKYGIDAFDFEVVERCDKKDLIERERFWITVFNSASISGFNTHKNPFAYYGFSPTQATRERISKNSKRTKMTEVHKQRLLAISKGRVVPEEVREKIRKSLQGRKTPESVLVKLRARKSTPESRAKTSAKLKGRKFSEQHIQRLKTKGFTPEHRAALSASLMRHPVSEATRAKMSAAKKAYWAQARL